MQNKRFFGDSKHLRFMAEHSVPDKQPLDRCQWDELVYTLLEHGEDMTRSDAQGFADCHNPDPYYLQGMTPEAYVQRLLTL